MIAAIAVKCGFFDDSGKPLGREAQALLENMMPNERFETDDLLLAAFLLVRRYQLLELRQNGTAKTIFVFAQSEQISNDAEDFADNAAVPIKSFARRWSFLRDKCRELKERNRREQHEQATRKQ